MLEVVVVLGTPHPHRRVIQERRHELRLVSAVLGLPLRIFLAPNEMELTGEPRRCVPCREGVLREGMRRTGALVKG